MPDKEQKGRPNFIAEILLSAAAVFAPSAAPAQPPSSAPVPIVQDLKFRSAAEIRGIDKCMDLIRSCQLENGAINMRTERDPNNADDRKQAQENGENPDERKVDTIRVIPYFANHSAMALVSAHHHHSQDPRDMERAAKWMHFYATNQDKTTGYIHDFKGSISKGTFTKSGQIDSVDAYASTFLQLADNYLREMKTMGPMQQRALEKILPPEELLGAAKLSLKAIESVKDKDGLTWAKPDYKVKFLLDNVEVYAGLVQGARYFDSVGAKEEAEKARGMAKQIAGQLERFWVKEENRFGWAIMENGKVESGMEKSYPHGLANLCGLAWISAKDEHPWEEVKTKFKEPDAHAPVERWLMAAIAVGKPGEIKHYQEKASAAALEFNAATNGHRPAMLALTLLEGRSWMPSIAEPLKEADTSRAK